jgi:Domain of unknown function (DUF4157)
MTVGPEPGDAAGALVGLPDDPARLPTLGERLAVLGLLLRDRHLPVYAWAASFAPLLRRLEDLDRSWADRFERDESGQPKAIALLPGRLSAEREIGAPGHAPTAQPTPGPQVTSPEPHGPARPVLPADVRARLRAVAGPGADRMRVRADATADALARTWRADAITIGTEVHVRSGRFRPDTPAGFALLAHEARHVTALLGRDGGARRATPHGVAAEEDAALRVERLARSDRLPARAARSGAPDHGPGPRAARGALPVPEGPTARSHPAVPGRPPSASASAASWPGGDPGATVPMRADVDRDEGAPAVGVPFDVEGLRRSLIDDLMRRLRSDFERGG